MKKILALIIACLMLISVFAACGEDDTNDGPAYVPPADDPYEKDDLPELNYGGEEVTFLYWSDSTTKDEFAVEEASDDMVKNAVYLRNVAVMERLGIKFKYIGEPGNTNHTADFAQFLYKDVFSGTPEYDLVGCYGLTTATCATRNLCLDLMEYDYIDIDKPWWPDRLEEEATINKKLYFASGDISNSYLYSMYMIFYNVNLIEEYKFDTDPVSYAINGTWTWDRFYEYCSVINGADLNNNGEVDSNERYAFIAEKGTLCPIFFSPDLRIYSHDNTGGISVDESCFSTKASNFVAEVNQFIHTSGHAYYDQNNGKVKDYFTNGSTLFMIQEASVAKNHLATKEGLEYGILPMPKYDEDQDEYVSTLSNQISLYAISSGTDIDEICSATLECMASQSYRQVTPVLYETVMKLRYAPTVESAQVYDIVRETVQFDLSRIFHKALDSVPQNLFKNCIAGNTTWGANAVSDTRTLNRLMEEVVMGAFDAN